jgi:hypothetical protein
MKRRRTKHLQWLHTRSRTCPYCYEGKIDLDTGICSQCKTAIAGYRLKRNIVKDGISLTTNERRGNGKVSI